MNDIGLSSNCWRLKSIEGPKCSLMPGSKIVLQHLIGQLVDEVIKWFLNESATLVGKEGVNHNHGQYWQVNSVVPSLCLNLFSIFSPSHCRQLWLSILPQALQCILAQLGIGMERDTISGGAFVATSSTCWSRYQIMGTAGYKLEQVKIKYLWSLST